MMKKYLTLATMAIYGLSYAQTGNEQLKTEVEKIKTDLGEVKGEIQNVKSENKYLKQVLDIKKPILEQEQDHTKYTITKVLGDKKDKRITISILIESKNENKNAEMSDIAIVDILGNEYKIDHFKSTLPYPKLSLDVPLKMHFSFKDIEDEPKTIKILRFRTKNLPDTNPYKDSISNPEFRDLVVTWQ